MRLSPMIELDNSRHPRVKTRGYSENLYQNIFLETTYILIIYKYIINFFGGHSILSSYKIAAFGMLAVIAKKSME
jgi:hypothetical protein